MLALHVVFVFFAGFGLFCLLWALMGFFLPHCRDGVLLCTRPDFIPVYLWLRGFGIVNCPLVLVTDAPDEKQRDTWAAKDIAVHSPDTLSEWLGKDIL